MRRCYTTFSVRGTGLNTYFSVNLCGLYGNLNAKA